MPAKNYHHGSLRESLLSVAAQMIEENGLDSVSMRKLATEADVSRTAMYHYFDSKRALLCALAQAGFERQRTQLAEVLDLHQNKSNRELVTGYVRAYIDFAIENPACYDLMFGREIWRDASEDDDITQIAQKAFKNYVDLIESWQKQGVIRQQDNVLNFAQVSWGMLHGLSRLMIDGIYINSLTQKETTDTVVDLLIGS